MKCLKRILLLAFGLGLGHAAAETTANCVQPAAVTFPLTTTWNYVNGRADGLGEFGAQVNTISNMARETGYSIYSYEDGASKALDHSATTPSLINIGDARFLRFGFVWADNGGQSYQTTFTWSYAGTQFLSISTSAGRGTAGTITTSNNAVLYNANGQLLGTSTGITGQASPYTITGADTSANNDRSRVQYVYLKLPDTLPNGSALPSAGNFSVRMPPASVTNGLFDDIRMYLPESVQSYLCLKKQQNSGSLNQAFQFTTTGINHKTNADSGNSNSTTIRPPALNAAYAKSTTPSQLTNPESVTIQETAPGFTISKVVCDTPNDVAGNPAQTQVSTNVSPITLTRLPFGAMTTCTVYNESTTQLVDKAPTVILAKNFTRFNTGDQVNLSLSTPNLSTALATSGTQTNYATSALKDTNYTFQTFTGSGSVGVQIAYPTYTFRETAAGSTNLSNYAVSYQCQNTTQGTTINLPAGSLVSPYTFTFQPTLGSVNLGDNITCTISNAGSNAGSLNIVKSGPIVAAPSKPTGNVDVTYTITVTSNGSLPLNAYLTNVVVADKYTNGTFKSATPAPTTSTAGKLTWNLNDFNYNDTTSRVITVVLTMPQAAAAKLLPAGSRNVSNTANYAATRYTCWIIICFGNNETGVISGVVTRLILMDEPIKSVRNITKGETVGSANNTGNPGDVLEYCVSISNYSDLPAENFVINDSLQPFLKPVGSDTDYALTFGTSTVRQNSPFSQNIGTVPAASSAGPGTAKLCFQAQIK